MLSSLITTSGPSFLVRSARLVCSAGRGVGGQQVVDEEDDLAAEQVDAGHVLVVGHIGHAVLQVEPGRAEGAEVGSDLQCNGLG